MINAINNLSKIVLKIHHNEIVNMTNHEPSKYFRAQTCTHKHYYAETYSSVKLVLLLTEVKYLDQLAHYTDARSISCMLLFFIFHF